MRLLLIIILCLSAAAQSPRQHTGGNKQNAQAQADKPTGNQNSSDAGKSSETPFYAYNIQKTDGNETVKIISDCLLAAFTLALVIVSLMQWRVLRNHDANLVKLAQAAKDNAQAAKISASAAKDSVQSVIHSDRAWVVEAAPQ